MFKHEQIKNKARKVHAQGRVKADLSERGNDQKEFAVRPGAGLKQQKSASEIRQRSGEESDKQRKEQRRR